MPTPNTAPGAPFKVSAMQVPEEPNVIPVVFDFATDAAQTLTKDLVREQQDLRIPFVQMVYIDNSGDANPLTMTFEGMAFSVTAKARTQGYYPLLIPEGPVRCTVVSPASAIKKLVVFMSMMVPPQVWATQ